MIVVDRALVVVFACTENATLPEPLPEAADVIVTQDAPADAVHAQSDVVVTVKLPGPPLAVTLSDVGLIA